jgi:predicted Zn-dependent protease with MMP-like domain
VPVRRRDRRGRGLRGTLAPADVPLSRTRAEEFDELVLDALARLRRRLPDGMDDLEVLVLDVPPADDADGEMRLADTSPAEGDQPARVVVYRRPIETRVTGERLRAALVSDVLVEELAALLGVEPETLDPEYGLDDGWED